MKLIRHTRWHWLLLGVDGNAWFAATAYVMDDFGNAVPIKYATTRISLRAGDA